MHVWLAIPFLILTKCDADSVMGMGCHFVLASQPAMGSASAAFQF